MALPSLIPAKPSLIQQKRGIFVHSADGERNVLIRPFQRHILCRGYLEYAGNPATPVLTMPFLELGRIRDKGRLLRTDL